MSALHPTMQVLRKEIREIARDKRVRTGALLTPIIVVILMVSLFGVIASSIGDKAKQKVYVVDTPSSLLSQLNGNTHLQILHVPSIAAGQELIRKGTARLVLAIEGPDAKNQITVRMLFDPKEDAGQIFKSAVQKGLAPYIEKVETSVLRNHGLTKAQIEPIVFKDEPVKVGEGEGAGAIIVGMLPYLMVLFTFTGGFSLASDLIAGEKEKSTLETLLITPVGRTEIVLGKFLALCVVCCASALSSVAGLFLSSALHLPGSELMFTGGLGLTPPTCLVILVCLLPLVAFFAALLAAVSSYARNTREAQTYLGIVNLLVIIPAVFSQVLGFTDLGSQNWINFVPVLGTAANIRAAFQGKPNWLGVVEAALLAAVLAIVMLRIAVHLFNREQVLVRV